MSYYAYSFETQIERLAIGNGKKQLYYSVVILPSDLMQILPFKEFPKLRVVGEIAEHPVRGAWNPIADGRKYFILSAKFLKNAGLSIGDTAEMRFNIDDQDFVEVPTELEDALDANPDLLHIWEALTPGKKRFYSYQITSAKRQETRVKRLETLITELLSG